MSANNTDQPNGSSEDTQRRGAVTIHDVAKHAGVSSMTVSRVINGQKYVSQAMRDKVNASVAALNFSPNAAARSLSGAVRVGLIYSNPSSSVLGEFLLAAFRQSADSGCQLLVEPSLAHASEIDTVRALMEAHVDAIILPPPLCDSVEIREVLEAAGLQSLSFATANPTAARSSVFIDDFEGARLMTRHLIELGHTDIAFIKGDPKHSPALRREDGFRAAMTQAGLAINEDWIVQGYFTYRSGLDATRQLLAADRRPTAIFASNDDMAAAAAAVAHGLGISLPEQLSIGGFDDTPVAMSVWPELSTIHQPIAEMAAAAVAMMADQVRRARAGEDVIPRHYNAEFTLVARASTGPRPS